MCLKKRLEKIRRDLKGSNEELIAKVDKILRLVRELPIKAKEEVCLMTKGICKLSECIAHYISEILNLVKP